MYDYGREFEIIARSYEESGGDIAALSDERFASLVVSGNKILLSKSIPGISIEGEEIESGVRAVITVEPGTEIPGPVHLCFGVIPEEGLQEISSEFRIGEGARVKFLAHCSFPNALRVKHVMDAKVHVGPGAEMTYSESHFHGEAGGTEVIPRTEAYVDAGGVFRNEFRLTVGRVGRLDLDLKSYLGENAVSDLEAKVYGRGDDVISLRGSIYLNGAGSRGLIRSRIVVSDRATSEVLGEAVGRGPFSRGHIDCVEIIQGREATAKAIPLLQVTDESSKLTHEAAIGSVDKRQVQTLMARGLSEEEAVETVVRGLLK